MMDKLSRSSALASELRRFAGWYLLTHCPSCGSSSEIAVDVLAKRHGENVEMYTITRKLGCTECKLEPDEVHLVEFRSGPRHDRILQHIQLWGDGSH